MPTITLRNVPEATLLRLKADAVRNRRSLNQEVIVQLAASLGIDLTEEAIEEIDAPKVPTKAPGRVDRSLVDQS